MLILLLDGLWAGVDSRIAVYEDNSGASLFVAQAGTKNLLGAVSVLPASTVDRVRADPDVKWAAPVRGLFSIMDLHERKVPAYLIGSEPGQPGGPWALAVGRAPVGDDEIAVAAVIAQRHGIATGDTLDVLGRRFTVVGIAADADMFMTSFVFMTHRATDQILQAPDTTSFVLVGTDRPDEVRSRLEAGGLAALTRDELKANDIALTTRALAVPLRLMIGVAFAVGSLVVALTAYSAIVERRRDYGIVKAIGAGSARLFRLAFAQTLMLAGIGLIAAALFYLVARGLIGWARPQFAIVLTPTILARTVAAAVVMAAVAAAVPARRLAKLDPSTAYRGG
jgi:putative ABC transport system permease protein